jgi:hypothetical protein
MIAFAFKGRDPHFGFSPTASKGKPIKNIFEHINIAFTNAGKPNRLAFVPYFGTAACDRIAPSSIFPSTGFANTEMPQPSKQYPLNYYMDGSDLLGDIHSFNNRMARELLYNQWNITEIRGRRTLIEPFMQSYQYMDHAGTWCTPTIPEWNPRDDEAYVTEMTRRYQHHRKLSYDYLLPLQKTDLLVRGGSRNASAGGVSNAVTLPTRQPLASVLEKIQIPPAVGLSLPLATTLSGDPSISRNNPDKPQQIGSFTLSSSPAPKLTPIPNPLPFVSGSLGQVGVINHDVDQGSEGSNNVRDDESPTLVPTPAATSPLSDNGSQGMEKESPAPAPTPAATPPPSDNEPTEQSSVTTQDTDQNLEGESEIPDKESEEDTYNCEQSPESSNLDILEDGYYEVEDITDVIYDEVSPQFF